MAIFVANQPFTFDGPDGVPRMFTKGDLIDDTDAGYKGREALFEPVQVAVERPAKQAAGESVEAPAQPDTGRRFPRGRGG